MRAQHFERSAVDAHVSDAQQPLIVSVEERRGGGLGAAEGLGDRQGVPEGSSEGKVVAGDGNAGGPHSSVHRVKEEHICRRRASSVGPIAASLCRVRQGEVDTAAVVGGAPSSAKKHQLKLPFVLEHRHRSVPAADQQREAHHRQRRGRRKRALRRRRGGAPSAGHLREKVVAPLQRPRVANKKSARGVACPKIKIIYGIQKVPSSVSAVAEGAAANHRLLLGSVRVERRDRGGGGQRDEHARSDERRAVGRVGGSGVGLLLMVMVGASTSVKEGIVFGAVHITVHRRHVIRHRLRRRPQRLSCGHNRRLPPPR